MLDQIPVVLLLRALEVLLWVKGVLLLEWLLPVS